MKRIVISLALAAILVSTAAAQTAHPAAAVRSFYAYDAKASQVFNRRNLDSRKRWLSASLYKLFIDELRKQNAQLKLNPDDKPFFGDGFPFRPIDEPCNVNGKSYNRRYSVQPIRSYRGSRVDVTVKFSYSIPCPVEPLRYKVRVIKSGSGWVIDDIIFDDGTKLSLAMKNNRY